MKVYIYMCIYKYIKVYKSKYKMVGVLPIRIVWSNVSSIGPSSERNRKYIYMCSLAHITLDITTTTEHIYRLVLTGPKILCPPM